MEIYIGACGQNKINNVRLKHELTQEELDNKLTDGAYATIDDAMTKTVINHFHLLVKRQLEYFGAEENAKAFVDLLMQNNPNCIIIGDEIGMGVIPIQKAEREYREIYGRVMCLLTKRAQKVVRIVCGIDQVIKES